MKASATNYAAQWSTPAWATMNQVNTAINTAVPSGVILMWSGTASNIPTGWALCDGKNGTPNLVGKFILGAVDPDGYIPGDTYVQKVPGDTGGESVHTLTISEMPSHTHLQDYNTMYADYNRKYHVYGFVDYRYDAAKSEGADGNYYGGTTLEAGGGKSHNNMPPYYALCYIMKL